MRDVDAGSFLDEPTVREAMAGSVFRVLTLFNRADTQKSIPTDSFSDGRLALPRNDAASTGNERTVHLFNSPITP